MSFPSLLGLVSYCVTALLCGAAGRRSSRRFWYWVAAFFVALAVWRLAGAEDAIRGALRAHLATNDLYAGRRALQAGIAGVVALAGIGFAVLLWRRRNRIGRNRGMAEAAMFGLAVLITLRLISLSAIDRVLYGGPVHLNWFLEGGLVALCAFAAFREWRMHG